MPCRDISDTWADELAHMKVDVMTRLLCDLTRRVEGKGILNEEEIKWLQWHKKQDIKAAADFRKYGTRQRVVTVDELIAKHNQIEEFWNPKDRPKE